METRISNHPMLFEKTQVEVLRAFRVGGQPTEVGARVTVEAHVARDLVATGKAKLVTTPVLLK